MRWLYEPDVSSALRGAHIALVLDDKRIMNVFMGHKRPPCLLEFARLQDRHRLRNWGKRSEQLFQSAILAFISRNFPHHLTRSGVPIQEPSSRNPGETTLGMTNQAVDSHLLPWEDNPRIFEEVSLPLLKSVFIAHEDVIWTKVAESGCADMTVARVAQFLRLDWPNKLRHRTIGAYAPVSCGSILRTRGMGAKKLATLLPCILWTICAGRLPPPPSDPVEPSEAIRLAELDKAESVVINLRFFQNGGCTLDEVGRKMGFTRERARQIQESAFERLRLCGLDQAIRKWLLAKDQEVFELLSRDGGVTVLRDDAQGTAAKKAVPGLAMALDLCDLPVSELLKSVAIPRKAGHWIRKV